MGDGVATHRRLSRIELLAPARDRECGVAAIDCGADAVYIGAPRFGARAAAGNRIEDIQALARHAHKYWARVYATLNTLLRDDEVEPARRLAWRLYEAGVDGLIVQDTGLLEVDLPPLPLIASTQMHNHTPECVAFLERVGMRRAILARELTLDEIRAIRRAAPAIELECFVHGALCVCYSGQCYLSYALGGRSGNRGECAQPCRMPYTLVDARGAMLARDRHLLSLRDLNLSDHLPELIDAGVSSFKIEGRLKDKTYVANVVAHYRARLDQAMGLAGKRRSSSGASGAGFTPDPGKTFNRGYTTYFFRGRDERMGSTATPKMVGEPLGRVASVDGASFTLDADAGLHAGDGLSFFDREGRLAGSLVNAVDGHRITPDRIGGIEPGSEIYRNHDHEFLGRVNKARAERRIRVRFRLGRTLAVEDEDGVRAEVTLDGPFQAAEKPERAAATIRRQLEKTGDTEFTCAGVEQDAGPVPFFPVSAWNALRREALDRLRAAREASRTRESFRLQPNDAPFPASEISFQGNVLNRYAEVFYRRHGVVKIEPAAESGLDLTGRRVMTTRYCIKRELGMCGTEQPGEPFSLISPEGRLLELRFDCVNCQMEIYLK